MQILTPDFYARPTHVVARELLGKYLVREIDDKIIVGMICETEAYTIDDPASHAFIGKTERNKSLFGPVGHAYVYISYGIHYCLNIVARDKHTVAGGVLIRGVNIVGPSEKILPQNKHFSACSNGPGKLTRALKITKALDGINLMSKKSGLYVCEGKTIPASHIQATPRIGISKAKDSLLRFVINNC